MQLGSTTQHTQVVFQSDKKRESRLPACSNHGGHRNCFIIRSSKASRINFFLYLGVTPIQKMRKYMVNLLKLPALYFVYVNKLYLVIVGLHVLAFKEIFMVDLKSKFSKIYLKDLLL